MGTRMLPLLVVTALTAMVAVLVLAIVRNDADEGIEIIDAGSSLSPIKKSPTSPPPPAEEYARSIADPGVPAPAPENPRTEPRAEPVPPSPAPGDPATAEIGRLRSEVALLLSRLTALEEALRRAEAEIELLKSNQHERPFRRVVVEPGPFDPAKLPKRKEFEETGKFVDNLPVYKATHDNYWTSLRLETYLHPEIRQYRIKWFSGNWSPWFTPGVDDEDSKANHDGTKRRIWSYFTDHEFQVLR